MGSLNSAASPSVDTSRSAVLDSSTNSFLTTSSFQPLSFTISSSGGVVLTSTTLAPSVVLTSTTLPSSVVLTSTTLPSSVALTSTTLPSSQPQQSTTSLVSRSSDYLSTSTTSATVATPRSTSDTKSSSSSANLSGGAVAGIAIGCFIAGVLLAAVMSLLVTRNHRKRRSNSHKDSAKPGNDKAFTFETAPAQTLEAKPEKTVQDILPQQVDDTTVQKRLGSLLAQTDNFAANYYANKHPKINADLEGDLSRFDSQNLSSPLAACFGSTERPIYLLKHCLCFYVLALTLSPSKKFHTLLPPDIGNTVLEVMKAQRRTRDTGDMDLIFSEWKVLTAYLRPTLFRDPRSSYPNLDDACAEAAHEFCQVFKPWSNGIASEAEMTNQLSTLIYSALTMALWLLSQPDCFEFSWAPADDIRDKHGRRIVTSPSVWKTHYRGKRLEKPQVIIESSSRTL